MMYFYRPEGWASNNGNEIDIEEVGITLNEDDFITEGITFCPMMDNDFYEESFFYVDDDAMEEKAKAEIIKQLKELGCNDWDIDIRKEVA